VAEQTKRKRWTDVKARLEIVAEARNGREAVRLFDERPGKPAEGRR